MKFSEICSDFTSLSANQSSPEKLYQLVAFSSVGNENVERTQSATPEGGLRRPYFIRTR
jgi:hypothetical protein